MFSQNNPSDECNVCLSKLKDKQEYCFDCGSFIPKSILPINLLKKVYIESLKKTF